MTQFQKYARFQAYFWSQQFRLSSTKTRVSLTQILSNTKPIVFWFLNHRLEKDELRRQVDEMKAVGFGGFFMHARPGLQTPYLSESWWEIVQFLIEYAASQGLQAWLYDESPYPSGCAGGKVVYDNPEFRARELKHGEAAARGGQPAHLELPPGRLIGAYALRRDGEKFSGEIVDITAHTGWVMEDWDIHYRHDSYYYAPYQQLGNPHWRAWTQNPFLRLEWTPPEGDWLLCGFVETEISFSPFDYYVDTLNPAAIAAFLKSTHHEYTRRFGQHFGTTIPGIFTDEPKLISGFSWSAAFEKGFRDSRGYDLREYLPHLVYSIDASTPVVRHDYRAAASQQFIAAFCRPIYNWAEENGIASTGHISPEEDPIWQTEHTPDIMEWLKWYQIPGVDIIGSHIGDARHPLLNMGPKLVSSVAHQQQRPHVICEAWGVSGWDLNLRDMKKIGDWLFVHGVNLITPHGQFYSIDGYRKRDAAPSQFYQASYWPYFKTLSEYVEQMGATLTGGRHLCDIAILHPHTTYDTLLPDCLEDAQARRVQLAQLLWELLGHQRDFDFINETTLAQCEIDNGCLSMGEEKYRVIILPWLQAIEENTAHALARFAAAGGSVLILGAMPETVIAAPQPGALASRRALMPALPHEIVDLATLPAILDSILPSAVRLNGEGAQHVFALRREKEGREFLLLFNSREADFIGALQWSRNTPGAQQNIALPLCLPAGGSLLLDDAMIRNYDSHPQSLRRRVELRQKELLDLSHDWHIEAAADNCLLMADWSLAPAIADDSPPRPVYSATPMTANVLEYYDLPAPLQNQQALWYSATFYARGDAAKAALVLEESTLQQPYEVFINEILIPACVPSRRYDAKNCEVDISPFLRTSPEGTINEIAIRVANAPSVVRGTAARPMMDAPRLFGDFRVRFPYAGHSRAELDFTPRDAHETERFLAPWADWGLPHYSGTMRYRRDFEISLHASGQPAILEFEEVHDLVRVQLNGEVLATLAWPPFVADVSGLLKTGTNELLLEVANSPINMIEGVVKKSGLLGQVRLRYL